MISRTRSAGAAQTALEWLQARSHEIILLEGWRRCALAFGAGALAALALAPLDLLPVFMLSFPVLVLLLDGTVAGDGGQRFGPVRSAFMIGWWFGFGYFIMGLWWLGAAFVIGGDQFIWLLPFGVIGLPAGLAIFMGLGAAIARLLWSGHAARFVALAFGLGVSEWLRANILTGFPWNGFGQSVANHLALAQITSVIGTDTLGLLLVAMGASFAALGTGPTRMARWFPPLLTFSVVLGLLIFGALRLTVAGGFRVDFTTLPVVPDVKLRIVQANITQADQKKPGAGADLLDRYLKLSDRANGPQRMGVADITHLIWPEAPLPFILDREPKALEALAKFLPPQTTLITGAIRAEPIDGTDETQTDGRKTRYRFYNALQVYDKTGLQSSYDKLHLVPFGEYVPFEDILRRLGLTTFVDVVGGFTPSSIRKSLSVSGFPPIIPMICFETIFPHELEADGHGEKVFLNVTNDAWFGRTFGPYQHLAQARLRSIEFGQPMIRAANTGISSVFDPYGRVVAQSLLEVVDILDSPLPIGLTTTLYREWIWFSYGSVMICFIIIAIFGRGRQSGRR